MPPKTLSWWNARRDMIDMEPTYQRRGRLWSRSAKAFLIDSIVNEYDIPKLYVADFTYGSPKLNAKQLPYAIIDGKQRFEAIFDFYDGKLTLDEQCVFREDPSIKIGGLGYKDVKSRHPKVAEALDGYLLSIVRVITDEEDLINDMFTRLNRSKPLTGSELRNAMSGPVPDIIRSIAEHEFFTSYIRFGIKRSEDLNAAAKILLFEFRGEVSETKKRPMDSFVKSVGKKDVAKLELAWRHVVDNLDVLTNVFLPRDKLLSSSGVVPVYYWFMRGLSDDVGKLLREFLVHFDRMRRENRARLKSEASPTEIDGGLRDYDLLSRSTNDLKSYKVRLKILNEYCDKFIEDITAELDT